MGAEWLPVHGLTSPRPATRSATTLEGGRSRLELGLLGEPVFEHVAREADMPPDAEAGQTPSAGPGRRGRQSRMPMAAAAMPIAALNTRMRCLRRYAVLGALPLSSPWV
jgi:hypothetical protein